MMFFVTTYHKLPDVHIYWFWDYYQKVDQQLRMVV